MLADGHKLYNVIYPGYDRRAVMEKYKDSFLQRMRDAFG